MDPTLPYRKVFPYYVGLRKLTERGNQPMDIIVDDKEYSFKELEQEIYRIVCRAGVEITKEILARKDQEIFETVDKKVYHSKGFRHTSIKVQYGEVEYDRRVYKTSLEDGRNGYVYLLDAALGMEKIGLISENLAEIIADIATETPYRGTAETVTNTTGISISAQGAWDIMQRIGDRINEEEDHDVCRMNEGKDTGKKSVPVLFEEMDGVWIRQQGSHHEKLPMQEVKVSSTYEGWDAEKEQQNRSTLVEKHILAGIEDSRTFHDKREADIRKRYDADEIGQRIVNGDGGRWIGEPNDPDAIIQLDPFHVHKEIRRLIADKDAVKETERLLSEKDVDGALSYIQVYADSVASNDPADKKAKNALALFGYLSNNKDALIPWQERGIKIPEAPDGLIYKSMGVQENQNCTVITLRMKHRRMRWSKNGGNNMAKALARKENHELHETISRYSEEFIFGSGIAEVIEVLSAAKAPKKDGKGSRYADGWHMHMPIFDAMLTEARKVFRGIAYGKEAM